MQNFSGTAKKFEGYKQQQSAGESLHFYNLKAKSF